MWFNGGMMGGFGISWILMFIVQLLFWATILYLIFVAIKKINVKDDHRSSREDKCIQILKERYAKGEISEEEYKEMKNILND